METKYKITMVVAVVAAIVVLSVINTTMSNKLTGGSTLQLSQEFPGISVLFVLVIGLLGIFAIRKKFK